MKVSLASTGSCFDKSQDSSVCTDSTSIYYGSQSSCTVLPSTIQPAISACLHIPNVAEFGMVKLGRKKDKLAFCTDGLFCRYTSYSYQWPLLTDCQTSRYHVWVIYWCEIGQQCSSIEKAEVYKHVTFIWRPRNVWKPAVCKCLRENTFSYMHTTVTRSTFNGRLLLLPSCTNVPGEMLVAHRNATFRPLRTNLLKDSFNVRKSSPMGQTFGVSVACYLTSICQFIRAMYFRSMIEYICSIYFRSKCTSSYFSLEQNFRLNFFTRCLEMRSHVET